MEFYRIEEKKIQEKKIEESFSLFRWILDNDFFFKKKVT